jgi:hypothetical protein
VPCHRRSRSFRIVGRHAAPPDVHTSRERTQRPRRALHTSFVNETSLRRAQASARPIRDAAPRAQPEAGFTSWVISSGQVCDRLRWSDAEACCSSAAQNVAMAVCHDCRLGTTVRNCTRGRRALRGRQSGVDLKPAQAAVVKSDGGERFRPCSL